MGRTLVKSALLVLLMALTSASFAQEQGDPRRFERMLKTDEPPRLNAEIAEIQRYAGSIDPVSLLAMSAKLSQLGRKDEALFWFYAGQLRARYVLAIAPSETRSQAYGAFLFTIGPTVHEYVRLEPRKTADAIARVLAWDKETSFDVSWLPNKPNLPEEKWSSAFEKVRQGLEELRAKFAGMPENLDECDQYRSASAIRPWYTKPDILERMKTAYSDAPVTRISYGVAFRLPANYLSPFAGNDIRDRDLGNKPLEATVFWPDLQGFTSDNVRDVEPRRSLAFYVTEPTKFSTPPFIAKRIATGAYREQAFGLDVYADTTAHKCFPKDVAMTRDSPGSDHTYMECTIDRDTAKYKFCTMSFYGPERRYAVSVLLSAHLLSQWREIKIKLLEKIESWRIAEK